MEAILVLLAVSWTERLGFWSIVLRAKVGCLPRTKWIGEEVTRQSGKAGTFVAGPQVCLLHGLA